MNILYRCLAFCVCITFIFVSLTDLYAQEEGKEVRWEPELTEQWEPIPRKIKAPKASISQPPSDATVLFDGTDLSKWEKAPGFFMDMSNIPAYTQKIAEENQKADWTLENDYMTVKPGAGNIQTKKEFTDFQLHVEWRTPKKIKGEGQGRGNSGIFLQGLYEVQVLDSYNNRTYSNGQAGSIYKQQRPSVNASLPPGEWQSYDILYEAPIFSEDSSLAKPAFVTVLHNGVLIQNHVDIKGPTVYIGLPHYAYHKRKMPIILQDHSNLVSYRNIWIREL